MTSSKVKRLARKLLRENLHNERSWRVIAREDFNGRVNHATLNRLALSRGEWTPKDEHILIALGLKKQRAPRAEAHQAISDMATAALLKAFNDRTEMPPVDPRILKQFRKLGWIARMK